MTATETAPAVPAARTASFIGQQTAVEQARAVAEVQGAIVVAQQCPRNMPRAIQQMQESCRQKALAERAFFRYSRGGSQITGPSIHMARELARCFGNVQYGISELRRDDDAGLSEMQAWAWDVENNTRAATTFVVPHKRDTKQGVKALVDMRDIYENNANNGARRLREQIFAILPTWFTEEAKDICAAAIRGEYEKDAKPMSQRIAEAVKAFGVLGVSTVQLEAKLARKAEAWNEYDVAQLLVIYTSLRRGETTVEDEFAPDRAPEAGRVTAAEIAGQQQSADPGEGEKTPPPAPAAGQSRAGKINQPQLRKLQTLYRELGVDDRDERLADVSSIVGRDIVSTSDLSAAEATVVLNVLTERKNNPRPAAESTESAAAPDGEQQGMFPDGGES